MIRAAVLGASGYGGGELLRLLSAHPEADVVLAASRTYADRPWTAAFPGLAEEGGLRFRAEATAADCLGCDIVFLARDNGVAMREAPALLDAGCKVIDLSADFRFRDVAEYNRYYPGPHTAPDLARSAVYGLPELHRSEIADARLVGNPGCYTTTSILALSPLMDLHRRDPLIDIGSVIIDAKSGLSGVGRSRFTLANHFPEANENVRAYNIAGSHRHTPEIEQELSALAGQPIAISFSPHVVPMTRGILATCYATLTRTVDENELMDAYRAYYEGAPFVVVTEDLPGTKQTLGTNAVHMSLRIDPRVRRVLIVACLDNLGKGMAGQAVQNMNIMCGLPETTGLTRSAPWP